MSLVADVKLDEENKFVHMIKIFRVLIVAFSCLKEEYTNELASSKSVHTRVTQTFLNEVGVVLLLMKL